MNTLRRRLVVGILVVLAGLTVHAQTATPGAPTLLALLSPANCSRTCFIGIQPGITTLAEFRNILSARGITYYVNSLDGNEANANLEWRLPLTGLGFTYGARSSTFVNTSFSNGIVRQMSIGLDIPIQTIIAAYGQPQQYRIADLIAYYLVYSQHKMIFQPISTDNTELAQLVMLFDDSAFNDFLNDSRLTPVTNCTQPTGLCSVQTATPTPLPSSATLAGAASATSTNAPLSTLRETFNASSCVVSCWDVIQPGVTSQSQLETLLAQRGVNYIVNKVSAIYYEYIWLPLNSPHIDTRNGFYRAGVTVLNDVVVDINLPVNIPLQKIVQEYGAPTIAYEAISNDSRRSIMLVYPSYGLYFEAISAYGLQSAWNVRVVGDSDLSKFFAGIPSNIQDCSLYSSSGCILATATPTPIPTVQP